MRFPEKSTFHTFQKTTFQDQSILGEGQEVTRYKFFGGSNKFSRFLQVIVVVVVESSFLGVRPLFSLYPWKKSHFCDYQPVLQCVRRKIECPDGSGGVSLGGVGPGCRVAVWVRPSVALRTTVLRRTRSWTVSSGTCWTGAGSLGSCQG